ncbi:MAG: beta-glucosidase, partial [Ruminococcaceae bacterium]|nr:beta-glucosidase [Oscillospiraceae bacterium]
KHFACNNKETNREESDSIVSERALREIYLKGFEICVKESKPKLLMTSYNVLNSIHTSENAELITGILRGEWGYEGLITTDWDNTANRNAEVKAGNDIRMSNIIHWTDKRPFLDVYKNENTRNELAICAKHLMELIMWLE